MSKDISGALARLRESATQLNALCDQGADAVRTLEEYLSDVCSVGIDAWVLVEETHPSDGFDRSTHLCYGRILGRFRVYMSWWDISMTDPDDVVTKPWAECTREDKLKSLPLIGTLVEAIESKIQERVQAAKVALDSVKALNLVFSSEKGDKSRAKQ